MPKLRAVAVFSLVLLFLSACAGGQTGVNSDEQTMQEISCIVVTPVTVARHNVDKLSPEELAVLEEGASLIDGVVGEELAQMDRVKILSQAQLDTLLTGSSVGRLTEIRTLANKMDCDTVLSIAVSRYRDRVGSDLSANIPASAAFEMTLIHAETGAVLWATSFDETQEALLSNLFSMGKAQSRGFKWITVKQMVEQGIRERLAGCPYLKK